MSCCGIQSREVSWTRPVCRPLLDVSADVLTRLLTATMTTSVSVKMTPTSEPEHAVILTVITTWAVLYVEHIRLIV